METPTDKSGSTLLMTVSEVAATFQIQPRTLYRWLDAGRIPKPIQLGGTTRFRRVDIELFVEAGSMPAYQRARRLQQRKP